eukprot:TRINITY_DN1270_c0_g1_i12.p1 TRINITY_DN1270_c0_g1~~TRINITY_DN1270_c0_g1_i12.p1  ORF type:complete len:291 (+),score=71.06 TRINITY_DN1270_c0_g1_i12:1209-2081(+)
MESPQECITIIEDWIPNGTCDNGDICSSVPKNVACCFGGFCSLTATEDYCVVYGNFVDVNSYLYHQNSCPSSGVCSDNIVFDSENVVIGFIKNLSVSDVDLTVQNDSSIAFDNLSLDQSILIVSGSNLITNGSLVLKNSSFILKYQLGNRILVGGCFVSDEDTTITIELESDQVSNTSGWNITVLQYQCIQGDIKTIVTINGIDDSCYEATPGLGSIYVSYSDTCFEDIQETTKLESSYSDVIAFVSKTTEIIIAVTCAVLVIFCIILISVFYRKKGKKRMKKLEVHQMN